MNRIGRVLCAVDFSPESHGAAEYAATLSRTLAVPMALLHSHHVPAMAAYGRAAAPDWDLWLPGPADERHELDLWVEELTRARLRCHATLRRRDAGRRPRAQYGAGRPAHRRYPHARRHRTNAARIVGRAHRPPRALPDVVVPPDARRRTIATILVATDFSPASRHAVRFACEFAGLIGARVRAVHVVHDEHVKANEHYEVHEHLSGMVEAAKADLRRMLADCPVEETSVRTGIPHEEIIEAAEAANADLVAVGLHGHNPVEAAFLGSTTNRLLRHAPCPVLVTR